ncbi:MAG TPA: branched-chain amino acid ABC transporter permease, partial [Ktedonobacteraceae bacterium]|nr:branched-chain amino acid ABC transporter permease [Ktedonobacteraceae bacterium]
MLHTLLLSFGFGLITASILAIASVGLSLQFGITNYINFAYGDLLTFGVYTAFVVNQRLGLNIWIGLVVAVILTAILAWLINLFILRPFTDRGTSPIIMLVVTLGVSLILQNVILAIFSEQFQNYTMSTGNPLNIGPFLFTPLQLGIIGLAIVTMLAVHALLRYTRLGKAMRAVSDSPELARISGINTRMIVNAVWLLAGGLGGLSGVVLAFNVASFTPTVGFGFLFVIFAAVILGGIGSPYGAIVGALVVGIATEMSAAFISSEYKTAIALAILIIALLIRPQGIFASRGRA